YKLITQAINSPRDEIRLDESQWKELETEINTVYGGFTERLLYVCKMRKQAYRICLLMKIGIPTAGISKLLCCTNQAVSNTKKRLGKRVFGKDGNAKTWDEYIHSV
ncbi:MAG: amino acid ABC transporter permease, partial [Prevotella sp.]|nr:amino acid ABC transporter permease [Prevotella sp.]